MAKVRDANFTFPLPFSWNKIDRSEPAWKPDAPLLLLPGICGSILNVRKKGESSTGTRAWVSIEHADLVYKRLWGKYNPDTKQIDCLEADAEVIVAHREDNGGLYPIDILDPELYVPLHVVYYYHNLIKQFQTLGYEPGKTLFGFGYDFRVDVVTHSMGGLVLRSLLAARPDAFESYIRKWVAVGVPFGGAPGFITDGLLTGVQFAWGWQEYFFVERATMHMAAVQSPAVHELVPPKDFEWKDAEPVLTLWMADPAGGPPVQENFPCSKLQDAMAKVMEGNQVSYGGQTVDWPMNPSCWQVADESQRMWKGLKLPGSCQFYSIYGMGYPTPYNVTYGSAKEPLKTYAECMQRFGHYSYVDGDNCVPVECAMADGLEAVERVGVQGDHRGLLDEPQVWSLIYKWLSDGREHTDWADIDAGAVSCTMAQGQEVKQPRPVFVGSKPAAVPAAEGKSAEMSATALWMEEGEGSGADDWVLVCVDNVLGSCWK